MRWIALSAVVIMSGCGGLERHSYPAEENDVLMYGTVTHVKPYTGQASESGWSRAGWGTLSGGLVVGAVAGLSDRDIGKIDAYSYVIKPPLGAAHVVNSLTVMPEGECVAVYGALHGEYKTLSRLPVERCEY